MTKLEEKLKELGYEIKKDNENDFGVCKKVNNKTNIIMGIIKNKIVSCYIYLKDDRYIRKQEDINKLQEALNIMENDREELKQWLFN